MDTVTTEYPGTQVPQIRETSPEDAPALAALTAGALQWMLATPTEDMRVLRLAAFIGGEPAGLVLSCAGEDGLQELSSIMVAPKWRGRGIAMMLLSRLCQTLHRGGRRGIYARWSSRLPRAAEFARLLASSGWGQPEISRHRMSWRIGDWPKGFPRRDRILTRLEAKGLRCARLDSLTGDLRQQFVQEGQDLIAQGRAPEWSNPAYWAQGEGAGLSQILFDETGAVQGWLVCIQQSAFRRWYIPQGWVVRERVQQGWLLGAIARLLQVLEEEAGPDTILICQPPADVPGGMEQMLDKHFGSHAASNDYLFESEYIFSTD
ncbi:GNAT family N-acetyltransferase [Pannonibacter phragmitetus]|uniref:GNAT family N-acetyltransferase n=1 Tax=Pannonibacter phragmitetus TaxID=121719 RepID=UPI003D2F3F07